MKAICPNSIAHGTALQRYGYRVPLATYGTFDKFVQDSGLEYSNIGGDLANLVAVVLASTLLKSLRQQYHHTN